jgi:hypothetical protein
MRDENICCDCCCCTQNKKDQVSVPVPEYETWNKKLNYKINRKYVNRYINKVYERIHHKPIAYQHGKCIEKEDKYPEKDMVK